VSVSTRHCTAKKRRRRYKLYKINYTNLYGSKTRWESGKRACPEKKWKPGKSACPEKQWPAGKSGSKATQWVSSRGTGLFGVKGNEKTYVSMNAMAKAIGKDQSGMSRAWRVAMETAPSSELRVCFRYSGLELVFYMEVDSGKN